MISVTGTSVALTGTPSGSPPSVGYTVAPSPTPADVFTEGATITATALGGGFPAFSVAGDAPAALAGFTAPTSFSRSAPFTLTWTAGTGDLMLLEFVTLDPMVAAYSLIVCTFPDSGSFALPAAAMDMVPAAHTFGTIILVRINETIVNPSSTTQLHLWLGTAGQSDTEAIGP